MTKVTKIIRSDKPIYDHPSFYDPNILFSSMHENILYVEEWKDIVGYGNYMISSFGRVFSKLRETKMHNGGHRVDGGIVMKPRVTNAGYLTTMLATEGESRCFSNHRLVATHFIKAEEGKDIINHIYGDKTDNVFYKLEWCTQLHNLLHALKTGLRVNAKGEDHAHAKLSNKDVVEIKEKLSKGIHSRIIAKEKGVIYETIRNIHLEKSWSHIKVDGFSRLDPKKNKRERKAKIKIIKTMIHQGKSYKEIIKSQNVSKSTLDRIRTGRIWKDVIIEGFQYR